MTPIAWAMLALLLLTLATGIDVALGARKLRAAGGLPAWEGRTAPLVSVIVPARNEAAGVERAVRSMLAQDYPAVEFVAVDDRSEDDTGPILDRLAARERRLTVVHVDALPPGWIGKNHALALGAAQARGEWLLFADADVVLRPDALGRVVRYAAEEGFDHVAMLPKITMPGLLLEAFVTGFAISFFGFVRPWKARDPKSRVFVGIGAFNLVRAETYRQAGGHRPIALRPDDDLMLGKLLKKHGARQDFVTGEEVATVAWYGSVGELARGLEKNAFAAFQYRVLFALPAILFHLTLGLGPLLGLVLLRGLPQLFAGVAVAWSLLLYGATAARSGHRRLTALLYPVVVVMFDYIAFRAMVLNLWHGGIRWRGTFYSLRDLRGNRI
ncbi:MAG: glycosyltransferase [Gemmatimonadales bacterium]|nr:glycosyltransferase [Gemmatimonadales bacterium]